MSTVISAKKLSKRYTIYHEKQGSYSTIVESISKKAKRFLRTLGSPFIKSSTSSSRTHEEFWALKDVSFDIMEGDRVGIIGKNGAGKSTLLKILSRIIDPTFGQVTIKGRIASLLEVGTGFHPELTGRENIFLNGAILGMRKAEILKKFDEIVAFSEIEKFLDTPVKYYSSGMYARLGFAIAAHLDPDILIVDEVLAVGDAQFQAKCLKKLDNVSASGKTVLFVSHSTQALSAFCNKGILLEKGMVTVAGTLDECLDVYVQANKQVVSSWTGVVEDETIRITQVSINQDKDFFYQNERIEVNIQCTFLKPCGECVLGIGIQNNRGQMIFYSFLDEEKEKFQMPASYNLNIEIDCNLFWQGEYNLNIIYFIPGKRAIFHDEIVLKFVVYPLFKNDIYIDYSHMPGIRYPHRWIVNQENLCLK